MLWRSVILVLLLVAACRRPEETVVHRAADNAETRGHIARFVSAGRTPAGFAELAAALEPVRHADDPRLAKDAELRLLALALPLVENARSQPIDAQVDRLALTVWPVLLAEPLTSRAELDVAPRAGERAAAYVARLCDGPGSPCGDVAPADRLIAVRALVYQRAEQRMRDALATCLRCGSSTEPGWRELEWRWESLDRAAARAAIELPRPARSVASTISGSSHFALARRVTR